MAVAELLAAGPRPQLGVWAHAALLVVLLGASFFSDRPAWDRLRDALVALSLIPLLRIVSFTFAPESVTPTGHLAIVGLTFVVASLTAARAFVYEAHRDLRLRRAPSALQVAIAPVGAYLGLAAYAMVAPPALASSLLEGSLLVPIAVLVLASFGEELYFRGLLLTATTRLLAPLPALVFSALAYGAMHLHWGSWPLVALMTTSGLVFGWFSMVTRSIAGVTTVHALANVTMFVIVPQLVARGG